jgi:hypothetical protein
MRVSDIQPRGEFILVTYTLADEVFARQMLTTYSQLIMLLSPDAEPNSEWIVNAYAKALETA